MSNRLSADTFSNKLYNSLPPLYRKEDEKVDYSLQRYLQIMCDGGFSIVIEETNGLLDLSNPEKIPSDALSLLFKQYGLEISADIPEFYLRKLLPMLGFLYKRKGTLAAIDYITSSITEVKAIITLDENFDQNYHVTIDFEIEVDYLNIENTPNAEQLLSIIKKFIPFYLDIDILITYKLIHTDDFEVSISNTDSMMSDSYYFNNASDNITIGNEGVGSVFGNAIFGKSVFNKTHLQISDSYVDVVNRIS